MSKPKRQETLFAIVTLVAVASADYFVIKERELDVSNMISLEGGEFTMGSDRGMPDERPAHRVVLDPFWIDQFEVTNAEFQEFVTTTGYRTEAEDYGDSLVFVAPDSSEVAQSTELRGPLDWWQLVPGADWQNPTGVTQATPARAEELGDHPVVQVSYADAEAYCTWQGKQLPTEAQFEYAARGGIDGAEYSWGQAPLHRRADQHDAVTNHWQGEFPLHNENSDGFAGTAPVGSFPANNFGLYDISGNVWEWVSDWYHPAYYGSSPTLNPEGVSQSESLDPAEPGLAKRSIRGGSYLCAENYCSGFRVSARMPADPATATNHTGFRCVASASANQRIVNKP